jgi:DNA polymerase III subunit epsilon
MCSVQRCFDDLGEPLVDVTFCVVDLETTGGSPACDAITEVGAVKVRGGQCLGTFQTLVNPGCAIPPQIVYLTGITQAMVLPAPAVAGVLPSLLEFLGDAVIVGHNVRFDLGFLQAALARLGYPRLANRWVDTCGLARRLVRDEAPNLKLSTLADRLRLDHRPSHRALDDALATTDLLHALLERAGTIGVLTLDDLFELPTLRGHAQAAKLKLTTGLPRRPGVYLFRDARGRVLYVGKAADLRRRVRSYFSGDGRRKVDALLRELATIDHIVCSGPLEAAVLEVRLIHEHMPRFNRRSKTWRGAAYLKLTLDERFPRLSVVRAAKSGDGCLYLGPLPSTAAARQVAEAIESAAPIRRCARRPPRTPTGSPCAPAQLGVATCPCAGTVGYDEYRSIVATVVRGLTGQPELLLGPLEARMLALARADRYEEAAATRDRAAALARAIDRQRRLAGLRRAGRVLLEWAGGGGALLVDGRLVDSWVGPVEPPLPTDPADPTYPTDPAGPLPRELADELSCVASWLEAEAGRLRLLRCDGELASPLPPLPRFQPSSPPR